MSGETENDESGWTVDTLHAHIRQRLHDLQDRLDERHGAQKEAITAALLSAEKAVSKAEAAMEKRFDSVNEFRAQLSDQAARFLQRDEYRASHVSLIEKVDAGYDRLAERIGSMENRVNMMTGQAVGVEVTKTGQRLDNGQLIAVVSVVLLAISIAVGLILALNG